MNSISGVISPRRAYSICVTAARRRFAERAPRRGPPASQGRSSRRRAPRRPHHLHRVTPRRDPAGAHRGQALAHVHALRPAGVVDAERRLAARESTISRNGTRMPCGPSTYTFCEPGNASRSRWARRSPCRPARCGWPRRSTPRRRRRRACRRWRRRCRWASRSCGAPWCDGSPTGGAPMPSGAHGARRPRAARGCPHLPLPASPRSLRRCEPGQVPRDSLNHGGRPRYPWWLVLRAR